MIKNIALILVSFFVISSCSTSTKSSTNLPHLSVSEDHRYLQTEEGDPFFWLGDTGWLLFGKLSREETNEYLQNRADNGYNVIQIMVLHTLQYQNYYGDSALVNKNVATPNVTEGNDFKNTTQYDFWDHVDYVIDLAAAKGLYVGLVPVWGSNVKSGGVSNEDAATYANWIANRYKDRSHVIWLNGGDIKGEDSTQIWKTIGTEIDKVVGEKQLITFHPRGRTTSTIWFHNEDWLDFNMFQSGHRNYEQDDTEWSFGEDNWRYVKHDLAMKPLKPTIDGEPSYEGIPQGLHDTLMPFWNDADVRRYAYWSVFAGAFGYTYGHSSIMQFYRESDTGAAYGAKEHWNKAINDPGALQMKYMKELMLSRSYFDRVPNQELLVDNNGEKYDYLLATSGANWSMVYTYNGSNIKVNGEKIEGDEINASWFNPRNGEFTEIGQVKKQKVMEFNPPGDKTDGNDWVLLVDY